MKRVIALLVLIMSFNSFAGIREVFEIQLLSVTVPAGLDDHGFLAMASKDFEFKFGASCHSDSTLWRFGNGGGAQKTPEFTVPHNSTNKEVETNLEDKKLILILESNYLRRCRAFNSLYLTLLEQEWIGDDELVDHNIGQSVFGRYSNFAYDEEVILDNLGLGSDESDWSIAGLGPNSRIKLKVRIKSITYKTSE